MRKDSDFVQLKLREFVNVNGENGLHHKPTILRIPKLWKSTIPLKTLGIALSQIISEYSGNPFDKIYVTGVDIETILVVHSVLDFWFVPINPTRKVGIKDKFYVLPTEPGNLAVERETIVKEEIKTASDNVVCGEMEIEEGQAREQVQQIESDEWEIDSEVAGKQEIKEKVKVEVNRDVMERDLLLGVDMTPHIMSNSENDDNIKRIKLEIDRDQMRRNKLVRIDMMSTDGNGVSGVTDESMDHDEVGSQGTTEFSGNRMDDLNEVSSSPVFNPHNPHHMEAARFCHWLEVVRRRNPIAADLFNNHIEREIENHDAAMDAGGSNDDIEPEILHVTDVLHDVSPASSPANIEPQFFEENNPPSPMSDVSDGINPPRSPPANETNQIRVQVAFDMDLRFQHLGDMFKVSGPISFDFMVPLEQD